MVIMTMKTIKTISVADAKKHLSELLGRILYGGEAFVIARRGRPIARLGPLDEPATRHLADAKGWLRGGDELFSILDQIVAERPKHTPRAARAKKTRRR